MKIENVLHYNVREFHFLPYNMRTLFPPLGVQPEVLMFSGFGTRSDYNFIFFFFLVRCLVEFLWHNFFAC